MATGTHRTPAAERRYWRIPPLLGIVV